MHVYTCIYFAAMINKLVELLKGQQLFWETVHKTMPKKKSSTNNVFIGELFKHFKTLDDARFDNEEGEVDGSDDESVFKYSYNRG